MTHQNWVRLMHESAQRDRDWWRSHLLNIDHPLSWRWTVRKLQVLLPGGEGPNFEPPLSLPPTTTQLEVQNHSPFLSQWILAHLIMWTSSRRPKSSFLPSASQTKLPGRSSQKVSFRHLLKLKNDLFCNPPWLDYQQSLKEKLKQYQDLRTQGGHFSVDIVHRHVWPGEY